MYDSPYLTNKTPSSAGVIDFRSDTVTQPTTAMRAAMAEAKVGDDVYDDDPMVNQLQQRVASLLGKEAGLFVSSGTQSNLCAMLAHCQRGEEILTGDQYHVFIDEAGGASVLGGLVFAPMPTDKKGGISCTAIDSTVKPDDIHYPISRLLTLENTVAGNVQSVEQINTWAKRARHHGLAVHLDGARLMNAAVKLKVEASDIVRHVDSVSLCLSKGLGAPAGSVLVGSTALIQRAKRWRKMLGGGMRQAGILAAAGLHAIDNHINRLHQDHLLAAHLAAQLATIPAITVDCSSVETNMVFMQLPVEKNSDIANQLCHYMQQHNILLGGGDKQIRLVTHMDINDTAVDTFIHHLSHFFSGMTL